MAYGPVKVYTATMSSAGTLSSEINLAQNWDSLFLEIPTMTSNTQLHIQAANASGGTYRRIKHPSVNASTVSTNDFAIASAATSCLVPIPNGVQFIKIEATATVDNGAVFRVICGF